ncbi:LbetaH domain-containing protein [Elstera litoralis]|uniref:hypothetical protein n=1 Tax=Elstera litoralis TaxID=552518 RepID=UPI0018DEBAF4|nr:hypothetical protein [Elstera litoralis]
MEKIAHFNFIGDSLIGPNVNMEAGSIIANHRNENRDKEIMIYFENYIIKTGVEKFGAVVGAHSCIGANAVLAPGTIIFPDTNVERLALIDQIPK